MNIEPLLEAINKARVGNIAKSIIAGTQAPVPVTSRQDGVAGIVDRRHGFTIDRMGANVYLCMASDVLLYWYK
jgi:hypothetical protein